MMEPLDLTTCRFSKIVLDHVSQPNQHIPMLHLALRSSDLLLNEPEHGAGILLRHDPTKTGFAHPPRPLLVRHAGGLQRCDPQDRGSGSHSLSLVQRRFMLPPRTAMATARFWPTSTTSRLPRVTPV